MVNMPLQGLDFCVVVLFLLLELLDHELGATHILFHIQALLVELVVVVGELLDGFLVAFILESSITIVLEDVLFFHFEGADVLDCKSFLLLKLLVLLFEELVGLGSLGEFLVDKLVLAGEGLDVLR